MKILMRKNSWLRCGNTYDWHPLKTDNPSLENLKFDHVSPWYKVRYENIIILPLERRARLMNQMLQGAILLLEASYEKTSKTLTIFHHMGSKQVQPQTQSQAVKMAEVII